ncbi:MAG TPA: MFS transporter, partial [Bryobacteraceae bacterium]|nr:MFS transporter [Bryobacteraceae bacterium]
MAESGGKQSGAVALILGTISFAVAFSAWGLIAAFAPHFREAFHLSATQAAFLIAVPVLLGSLVRLPVGMLADRFGGRAIQTLVLLLVVIPAFLAPAASTYSQLLWCAFFLGIAGSSFSAGAGFVSRWFGPEKQGTALGVYGMGNIGQSAAVFLGPLLAVSLGWQNIFRGVAALVAIWAA